MCLENFSLYNCLYHSYLALSSKDIQVLKIVTILYFNLFPQVMSSSTRKLQPYHIVSNLRVQISKYFGRRKRMNFLFQGLC